MQHAPPVQLRDALHELPECRHESIVGTAGSIGAADVLDEAHTIHQLHREETLFLLDEELVETGKVRMGHVGEAAKLPLQPIQIGATGAQEGLEGDDLVADAVVYS